MKYFIDFEATQFSNEIISIGCVDENGRTFYSLVNVPKKQMSNFITELTGITKEDVATAPSNDEVFSEFYNWLEENKEPAEFFCYGNSDLAFIKKNIQKTKALKAQAALSILAEYLTDYSLNVIQHFGLIKAIGLKKVLAYYRNVEDIEQTHNALEDAWFLKEVYEYVENDGIVTECPFKGYEVSLDIITDVDMKNRVNNISYNILMKDIKSYKVICYSGKRIKQVQSGYEDIIIAAENFIKSISNKNQTSVPNPDNIIKKIIKANNRKDTYGGYYWMISKKTEEEMENV